MKELLLLPKREFKSSLEEHLPNAAVSDGSLATETPPGSRNANGAHSRQISLYGRSCPTLGSSPLVLGGPAGPGTQTGSTVHGCERKRPVENLQPFIEVSCSVFSRMH